ncbi:MAG: hypothetical protein EAZ27_13020 [Cytophagales bacterium]|nr:MAG: hypothetical protein EAZ27_13020 [Cytophagales bacterium]
MIKTIAIPQNNTLNIEIPNHYIGKKIEILFYSMDEIIEEKQNNIKTKLSEKYKGIITKEQGESLNAHIKDMRNEWNRNI